MPEPPITILLWITDETLSRVYDTSSQSKLKQWSKRRNKIVTSRFVAGKVATNGDAESFYGLCDGRSQYGPPPPVYSDVTMLFSFV